MNIMPSRKWDSQLGNGIGNGTSEFGYWRKHNNPFTQLSPCTIYSATSTYKWELYTIALTTFEPSTR